MLQVLSGAAFTEGSTDQREEKQNQPLEYDSSASSSYYPPVLTLTDHENFLYALWSFFCSPLPPSRVDFKGDVVLNAAGEVISYPAAKHY